MIYEDWRIWLGFTLMGILYILLFLYVLLKFKMIDKKLGGDSSA